ncbi:unnamed protein product [Staurois parvus]|uniref:Uncharacterized protein n=1 Tax=Staurois parvus TaxID=386267 RepID=A0ABN9CXT7_9NEOB|nr:unnamed protein product [Staurois parvus]
MVYIYIYICIYIYTHTYYIAKSIGTHPFKSLVTAVLITSMAIGMQTASTSICERMGHSQELSEFKRATVIGCHMCNKSIHEISLLLNISRSTFSDIITKLKQLGTTATQPQSGRPHKMTERGQRMLKHPMCRSCQLSAESIAKDLQTSCGLQISTQRERASCNGFPWLNSCIQVLHHQVQCKESYAVA